MKKKTGILLLNLGTPDSPETPDVRKYLQQFLTDGRVIDINPVLRYILVYLIISTFRAPKSAKAYKKVWMEEGSPLLVYTDKLTEKIAAIFPDCEVKFAMRYGNPSIESAIQKFVDSSLDRLLVVPLYPQYASSTTGSSLQEVYRVASKYLSVPSILAMPPFYDHPAYIKTWTEIINDELKGKLELKAKGERDKKTHFIFSYHGLPERHLKKQEGQEDYCLKVKDCCSKICDQNRMCYRAHCKQNTLAIANALGLDESEYTMSFQSRLGKDKWVDPYTDATVEEAAKNGVKRMVVFCPSFVADCLETIEEIGMEAKEEFLEAGGEEFILVPCLNDHDLWAEGLAEIIKEQLNA